MLTIRRTVAVSSAVRVGSVQIEGMNARLAADAASARELASTGLIAVLVEGDLPQIERSIVVDARYLL